MFATFWYHIKEEDYPSFDEDGESQDILLALKCSVTGTYYIEQGYALKWNNGKISFRTYKDSVPDEDGIVAWTHMPNLPTPEKNKYERLNNL